MSAAWQGRALDPARPYKPLDFGADGVIGSVDRAGRLIALNGYHPHFGFITLTGADPFPEDQRYNPAAVRRYRASLVHLDGFGPQLPVASCRAELLADAIPRLDLTLPDGQRAQMIAWAAEGGAFQRWELPVAVPWRGQLSLQRCAYTQLTEGGPLPMPPVQTHAHFADGVLTIANPALGWAVAIAGFAPGPSWERRADGPLAIELSGAVGTCTLVYAFGPTAEAAREKALHLAGRADVSLETAVSGWQALLAGTPDHLAVRRGLSYGLMLAVPIGETRCLLTDHMLLPLSWNRDAYYVARAFLQRGPALSDVVRRHLLWMFEIAERPDGAWGRCYLANGQIKDAAFQLDQQLFPLLELTDYVRATGDRALWERLRPAADAALTMILARRSPDAWLFPTDETPADDPLALPYHFSSHVLLWHTLRRLAALSDDARLIEMAGAVRDATLSHFRAAQGGQTLYAYATDGHGAYHFYHDANDLPLVLAPVWGFTTADDPVWRATVDFAFSAANEGGYYAGRLGSVHTRAPWPLGDVQDLLIARLLGDAPREKRAWAHLESAMQWDGALPEACDADTGAVVSRHWFAWPNAALACLALGAFETER
ncbi:MAG: hypothetical protein Kow00106_08770 [Anaerolineae bacterium]